MRFGYLLMFLAVLVLWTPLWAQVSDGKLQLHHIDMGQDDSAVAGRNMAKRKDCGAETDYLKQLGVKAIDYLLVSRYHYDQIDCIPEVLARFPPTRPAYDRGTDQVEFGTTTYGNYIAAVGDHRTHRCSRAYPKALQMNGRWLCQMV